MRNWNIRDFFLCVDPSVCRDSEPANEHVSYPEQMLLLYGCRNGREYDQQMFPTTDLTPLLQEIRKDATCLVFCPLYYRDRSFGYVAMNLGTGTGSALYSVLMMLNGALMSLYLQTSIKRSALTIEQMAVQDIMTGLLNRRGYMEQAPIVLDKARAEGKTFALLSADMNHMKDINDQHGHLAGDEAICRMGRAMQSLAEYHMKPVHISGDEFLAYGIVEDPETAGDFIDCVRKELNRINREEPWVFAISASFGVYAGVPKEEDTLDLYMTLADRAMYADKNRYKYGRRKEDKTVEEEKD